MLVCTCQYTPCSAPVYTVDRAHCTLQWPVYSVYHTIQHQCTVYIVLYSVQCTVYTILYSDQLKVYTILYSDQCTVYTILHNTHCGVCANPSWPRYLHWVAPVTVYSVQCTVYGVRCTVYSVQCTVYSVQCQVTLASNTGETVKPLCDRQCWVPAFYTLHSTLYTLHSTLYTLHSTLYTVSPGLCTLYTAHWTLNTGHFQSWGRVV